ncbi:KTSC domain-containing protein [Dyadobacter sp. CY312]|uniref:KTSC domain-containing protein n=1 Tax=Dyadobacter sp. CY312 TaxID=2907303 RepID=UPI001F4031A7|nr:KTSC domain-containing protein [Dyadobacter sp. CY312]MCE7038835.1 KTSC domain-containing protein [Dyadobacter sp. CY312]
MPSSVVAGFFYDPLSRILTVKYVSGTLYDYLDVPEEEYEKMKAAFSKGTFLNQSIKGKYAFKKRTAGKSGSSKA